MATRVRFPGNPLANQAAHPSVVDKLVPFTDSDEVKLKRVKSFTLVNNGPQSSQHYENSHVIWDHAVLPAITPVEAGTRFAVPLTVAGRVNLVHAVAGPMAA